MFKRVFTKITVNKSQLIKESRNKGVKKMKMETHWMKKRWQKAVCIVWICDELNSDYHHKKNEVVSRNKPMEEQP